VALRVVGHVDQEPADRCRQLFPAYLPFFFQFAGVYGANSRKRSLDSLVEFGKNGGVCRVWVEFCFHCGELRGRELRVFGVGEQAVNASRDMAKMKRYWRNAGWPRVKFVVVEIAAPARDVFACQLERVYHGASHGWHFGESSAEPRFRSLNLGHGQILQQQRTAQCRGLEEKPLATDEHR
jgi:hypothetical protein